MTKNMIKRITNVYTMQDFMENHFDDFLEEHPEVFARFLKENSEAFVEFILEDMDEFLEDSTIAFEMFTRSHVKEFRSFILKNADEFEPVIGSFSERTDFEPQINFEGKYFTENSDNAKEGFFAISAYDPETGYVDSLTHYLSFDDVLMITSMQ